MSGREAILMRIRANKPRLERPLPAVPHFESNNQADLRAVFKASLERMGGHWLGPAPEASRVSAAPAAHDELEPALEKLAGAAVVCSTVPEIPGNRDIDRLATPQELADVDFAIVRAAFAVAETGSVLLDDAHLKVNAVAYLPQHLIVLLDPADIVPNLHDAYRRPEFRERHYAAFHTGPSATADIEGVLIHGAQGVRSLSVLLVPRAASSPPPAPRG